METVPTDILNALFVIMCSVPSNMNGMQVYDTAIPKMEDAYNWIINYGHENGVDNHGATL